ncbi:hypothetical protein OUZ56_005931 [Daphnia magna]|uniref:Uncharacterized protein n=1 Tax=Daphnia magna TaxID=35525 RepID=A0ABQ9YU61_9CRUS|nr:hypothetical protein OUZ56_005931 [Daphnia magna]
MVRLPPFLQILKRLGKSFFLELPINKCSTIICFPSPVLIGVFTCVAFVGQFLEANLSIQAVLLSSRFQDGIRSRCHSTEVAGSTEATDMVKVFDFASVSILYGHWVLLPRAWNPAIWFRLLSAMMVRSTIARSVPALRLALPARRDPQDFGRLDSAPTNLGQKVS